MNRNSLIAMALLAGAFAERASADVVGKIDYQKTADGAAWAFDNSRVGIPGTMLGCQSNYDVDCLYEHGSDAIRISIVKNGQTAYSWIGSRWSVFQIVDDRLYYADFGPGGQYAAHIIAVDLRTGKEMWRSDIVGLTTEPPIAHSPAVLLMTLSVNTEVVTIQGEEMGRYIEFKDIATGKTVGHKVFPRVGNTP